jgi:hypothetical protein
VDGTIRQGALYLISITADMIQRVQRVIEIYIANIKQLHMIESIGSTTHKIRFYVVEFAKFARKGDVSDVIQPGFAEYEDTILKFIISASFIARGTIVWIFLPC